MTGKEKYKMIQVKNSYWIGASYLLEYVAERAGDPFGWPVLRTVRLYSEEGMLDRPQKLGKESYYDVEKTYEVLVIIKMLSYLNFSKNQIKAIVLNAKKHGELKFLNDFLEKKMKESVISNEERDSWYVGLSEGKPSEFHK